MTLKQTNSMGNTETEKALEFEIKAGFINGYN